MCPFYIALFPPIDPSMRNFPLPKKKIDYNRISMMFGQDDVSFQTSPNPSRHNRAINRFQGFVLSVHV